VLTRNQVAFASAIVLAVAAQAGAAGHFEFLGPHPIAAKLGGGYCYIEAPHLHAYPPDHPALYQQVGQQQVFTGDPTPFGYEGERHAFYGHHPVRTVDGQVVYCYIDGPHSHPFEAAGPGYKTQGDVAFYVGPLDPGYARIRLSRAPAINAEYRPYASFRPVVQVQPPPEWHGEIYVAPPAVQVGVQVPGVDVGIHAPGMQVGVRGPAVQVGVGVRGPGVFAPGQVVVGGPGPGFGRPEERGHREERHEHEHHDNGKHLGWDKHDHH
jgi:hypothetical protein